MYSQGDIYLANLNPTLGQEQSGIGPVLIVSGNSFNQNNNIFIVCPITSKLKKYYGDLIVKPNKTNGLSEISEILGFQIRTLSKERLIKKIGNIEKFEVDNVLNGINILLTL
ncbi:type II toxin-antitoxin system PemK/MazF family toxin [Candidatus Gracilibacteria bacterium]|nr:type II toxin-antitoxin system PemK/MazF family toxin [Candidatus Gracilibacteria bacterium]